MKVNKKKFDAVEMMNVPFHVLNKMHEEISVIKEDIENLIATSINDVESGISSFDGKKMSDDDIMQIKEMIDVMSEQLSYMVYNMGVIEDVVDYQTSFVFNEMELNGVKVDFCFN